MVLLEQASPSQLVSVFVTMYKQKRDYLVAKSKQPPTVPLPLDFSDEFLIVDEQNDFLDCGLKFDETANPGIGVQIPDDIKMRPFFFIRLLQESMVQGVYLSSELFVHRQVWD